MSRQKITIVGIIAGLLLISSLFLTSQLFASSAESASTSIEQSIGETCDLGAENYELIIQAQACKDQNDSELENESGVGVNAKGELEDFDVNTPTGINCEEILQGYNESLLESGDASIFIN